jgi:hypothetical protein
MQWIEVGKLVGNATRFAGLGQAIEHFNFQPLIIPTAEHASMIADAQELRDLSEALELPVCMAQATRVLELLARVDLSKPGLAAFDKGATMLLSTALGAISSNIRDELGARLCVTILPSKSEYLKPKEPLFGSEVQAKFSSVTYEIEEAAKCLAFERSTACVFHLMRVLEVGIKSAARCLNIADPVKDAERNWGAMLRALKSEMERRNKANPKLWKSTADKEFFEEIYASIDAVRNVWRNATMHIENKYTEEEAEHILSAVRGFMRKLASRVDEHGLPQA